MRFVLAGQPNSGKSTIFNAVAGYRSATANFPGSSTSYTTSRALILGREVEIVDLPGIYSLTSTDATAGEAESYLLDEDYDLVIDIVDASRLGRSLELTLQLLELRRPMVVALNMMDDAERRGVEIDLEELSRQLGVPVIPTIGRRGRGLRELFRTALQSAHAGESAQPLCLDREVEDALKSVVGLLEGEGVEPGVPLRFSAGKLLEGDPHLAGRIFGWYPQLEAAGASQPETLRKLEVERVGRVTLAVAPRLDEVITVRHLRDVPRVRRWSPPPGGVPAGVETD